VPNWLVRWYLAQQLADLSFLGRFAFCHHQLASLFS
jgi:hypothetical protein